MADRGFPDSSIAIIDPKTGVAHRHFWRFLASIWRRAGGWENTIDGLEETDASLVALISSLEAEFLEETQELEQATRINLDTQLCELRGKIDEICADIAVLKADRAIEPTPEDGVTFLDIPSDCCDPPINLDSLEARIGSIEGNIDFVLETASASGGGGGGASIPVEDEGTEITAAVDGFDFVGAGVTATASGDTVTVTISGGTNIPVDDEGSQITAAVSSFDFVGAGVTATNVGNAVTVTIPGGGGSPTRTAQSLTGAQHDVSIPSGVTWFRFSGVDVVMASSSGTPEVRLLHTSGTVVETQTGIQETGGAGADLSGVNAIAFSPAVSGTSRDMFGTVVAPREARVTISEGTTRAGGDVRTRWVQSDGSNDDDTIRFIGNGANFSSGTVEIEWFYN